MNYIVDPADFTADALAGIAPICGEGCPPGSVRLTSAAEIYPHRPDLAGNWRWRCSCGAHCGTHPNLTPLGTPASQETSRARAAAHAAFDPLWRRRMELSGISQKAARGRAYKWLAEQMGMERKDCHIGMMTAAQARRVVEICSSIGDKRKR